MGARGRKSKAQLMVVPAGPAMSASAPSTKAPSVSPPPADLGPAGKKLWLELIKDFTLETSSEVQQLYEACVMEDRAVQLRARIDAEGVMPETLRRDHPLLKHELAARAFVVRTLANLFPPTPVEKPPRYRYWLRRIPTEFTPELVALFRAAVPALQTLRRNRRITAAECESLHVAIHEFERAVGFKPWMRGGPLEEDAEGHWAAMREALLAEIERQDKSAVVGSGHGADGLARPTRRARARAGGQSELP